ncbi:hypothetical protein ACNHKD_17450 [Methylocystis sp. JAN1]|uniref:hypothetical protein n=1 Tax=Methylocystis sp. JAN1 TaxID=3397211 RepID=UPI003FA2B641
MKSRVISGAALAVAAMSLALAASPAQARHKSHRAPKATAEKHNCGGKNGCPAKAGEEKAAPAGTAAPAAPAPAGEKPAETK